MPKRFGAGGLRIPGLHGTHEVHPRDAEGLRNRREAALRTLFGRTAGALEKIVEGAIPYSGARRGGQLWHRGTTRRASARHEALVELCMARGCPLEDAKELVQEAHLRLIAYQRSGKVTDADCLLRIIVINLSTNYYHRKLSRSHLFERIDKLDKEGILIDPTPGPERALAAEQQLDRVVSLVSAVSGRTCQIFIAQRGGYSYEEVAAAFAIKPRTVEKHIAHATSTLGEMMPAAFAPSLRSLGE